MDNKWIVKSKTFWGIVIMVLPAILPLVGVEDGAEVAGMADAVFNSLLTFVGGALALYGRFKATDSVTLAP